MNDVVLVVLYQNNVVLASSVIISVHSSVTVAFLKKKSTKHLTRFQRIQTPGFTVTPLITAVRSPLLLDIYPSCPTIASVIKLVIGKIMVRPYRCSSDFYSDDIKLVIGKIMVRPYRSSSDFYSDVGWNYSKL